MSTDSWKIGLDGNWASAANWTSGVPASTSDVTIDAFGTYTVTISANEGTINSLTLNAAGGTLAETAAGSLTIANDLDVNTGALILNGSNDIGDDIRVDGGTATLNGANNIGQTVTIESGGIAEVGNAGALSTANLVIGTGTLLATATETLSNHLEFDISGASVIAAAPGKVLTLSEGNWATSANSITFGTAGNNGTVVWDTNAGASAGDLFQLVVQAGTLQAGDANLNTLFSDASSTTVDAGARINLVSASSTILDLEGTGIVTSSAGAALVLATDFSANTETITSSFRGTLSLEVLQNAGGAGEEFTFTGNNTYTGGTTIESRCVLTIGDGGTDGTLGNGAVEDDGNLFFDRGDTVTIANTLLGTGDVVYQGTGTYIVNHTNSYTGSSNIDSGTYETNTATSLSSGDFEMAGEFIATANMALHNQTDMSRTATFAVAHGKTLTLAFGGDWSVVNPDTHIVIGDTGDDGAVVWKGGDGTLTNGGTNTLEVRDGTFTDGDGTLNILLSSMATTTVDAGASIVMAEGGELNGLLGTGTVAGAASTNLIVDGAQFGGTFQGGMNLIFQESSVLIGDSTNLVGNVRVDSSVALGKGGTTGSLGTATIEIEGAGNLIIDHSNAFALTNDITGGDVITLIEQLGTGTTTIDRANTYVGGTLVAAGELSIDRATAIGSGALDLQGGELLVTGNVLLKNSALNLTGDITIAAATGKQLVLDTTNWSVNVHSIKFGDGTHDGTIVWHTPGGSSPIASGDQFTVDIAAGTTLKVADGNIGELLGAATSTTIEASATFAVGAVGGDIGNLLGSGTINGTSGTLQIDSGAFSGQIKGGLSVSVDGALTLAGKDTFTGQFILLAGATLTLDTVTTQDVALDGDATVAFVLGKGYSGTVSHFDNVIGQTLDFGGLSFVTATEHFANGLLTISDGTHSEHAKLSGTFSDANFVLSDDHHGGTDVNYVSNPVVPLASDYPAGADFW